jgi:hypothetical protein
LNHENPKEENPKPGEGSPQGLDFGYKQETKNFHTTVQNAPHIPLFLSGFRLSGFRDSSFSSSDSRDSSFRSAIDCEVRVEIIET